MLLMEDRALRDAWRAGDPAALRRVYEHYRPEVARLLRGGFSFHANQTTLRFTGYADPFTLEDALQETFLRAFREGARLSYNGLQPFKPWLLGIARNLVIDDYRRRRRELALFVPEAAEPHQREAQELAAADHPDRWGERAPDPERALHQRRQAALLQGFLESLDDGERALVQHHFVEQRSQEETARALGMDRNRVRRLIQDIRLKLLRFMKRHGQIQALDPAGLIQSLALGPWAS
jgi:RNA polymerase sigma-70 factor (ECF subfamily)